MKCFAKHTKFQPADELFRCPKCNAEAGEFCIDSLVDGADEDCCQIHVDDELYCYICDYRTTGQAFANRIKRQLDMVPCPHCKGTGHVKREKK